MATLDYSIHPITGFIFHSPKDKTSQKETDRRYIIHDYTFKVQDGRNKTLIDLKSLEIW